MEFKDSVCSLIKLWEEADASLLPTSKRYMELCLNLGYESILEGANPQDLVSRIDSIITAIHITITCHLDESTAALARTRNRFASAFFRLPGEIISKIFMSFVYDRTSAETRKSMKDEIWLIYRRLYTLLGICSVWKDILTYRGALWSVVPIISNLSTVEWGPSEYNLQRAGGSALHLAAATEFPSSPTHLRSVLLKHSPRFHTIDLDMESVSEIRNTLIALLQRNTPKSLSQLRIQLIDFGPFSSHTLPDNDDYILPHNSRFLFADFVKNLATFRISDAHFHWGSLTFSNPLADLWIEVVLGHDDAIISFARALSSASNLRDIKIISVMTFQKLGSTLGLSPSLTPPVVLPALQSLHLQGLYLNTLECILSIIAPGPYNLALLLTCKGVNVNFLHGYLEEDSSLSGLCSLMRRSSVNTLMIDGHPDDEWLMISELGTLFKSMPALKTLNMYKWNIGKGLCQNLTRTDTQTASEGPALQNLHLTSTRLHSRLAFQDMVAGHPLRRVVLGGTFKFPLQDKILLQEDNSIVQWLRGNAPDLELRLVERRYYPLKFQISHEWPLW
ncbi:hypothetical protein B0J17DRAFT_722744 [Rhizoctonia solani]|nr:hypothetical protein B0J17DRAFT_722744 [Rhizoctonia solani]